MFFSEQKFLKPQTTTANRKLYLSRKQPESEQSKHWNRQAGQLAGGKTCPGLHFKTFDIVVEDAGFFQLPSENV